MKGLKLYDYEKVKNDYEDSLEVITPPNNDGSRLNYSFPNIKIQGTTSTPLSNPFSKEKYIQRFRERRRY